MAEQAKSYNFASGSVAALSQKLMSGDRLLRMADSPALSDALKLLSESGYGEIAGVDFETALEAQWLKVVNFAKSVSAEPDTTDCFFLAADFRNLKILMKNKFMRAETKKLSECGTIEPQKLKDAVGSGNFKELPPEMAEACQNVENLFKKGGHKPNIIDDLFDKAYYQTVNRLIQKSKSQKMKDYFSAEIDGKNLIMFFRLRKNGFSSEYFENLFLEGGAIEKNVLLSLYGNPFDDIAAKFKSTSWHETVQAAIAETDKNASLAETEKLVESRKRAVIAPYKNDVGSILPLVNYLLAKKTEIDNIRLILVCKKNKVDKDKITKRLRELYV